MLTPLAEARPGFETCLKLGRVVAVGRLLHGGITLAGAVVARHGDFMVTEARVRHLIGVEGRLGGVFSPFVCVVHTAGIFFLDIGWEGAGGELSRNRLFDSVSIFGVTPGV